MVGMGLLFIQEQAKGTLDGELATVLSSIATACKQIASLVTRAGISNLTGMAGAANIQVRLGVGTQRWNLAALVGSNGRMPVVWGKQVCPDVPAWCRAEQT